MLLSEAGGFRLGVCLKVCAVAQYWWRSPLWGRGDSGSAPSGQTLPQSATLAGESSSMKI